MNRKDNNKNKIQTYMYKTNIFSRIFNAWGKTMFLKQDSHPQVRNSMHWTDLFIFRLKLSPVIESYITVILAIKLKFFRLSDLSMGLYHLAEYQLIDYHVMPYMRKNLITWQLSKNLISWQTSSKEIYFTTPKKLLPDSSQIRKARQKCKKSGLFFFFFFLFRTRQKCKEKYQ